MTRLNAAFNGKKVFVAYLTAGDPSLAATSRYVEALAKGGAGIVELGVPYSDPIADGPTNIRAAERGLRSGTHLEGIFAMVADLRSKGQTVPIVLFTYFNPILRMGVGTFARRAREAGVDGALFVDLPPEEFGPYRGEVAAADLETVFLCSPTTSPERLAEIDRLSTGFVYYISRAGVTGMRSSLPEKIGDQLIRVRSSVKQPVAVGFGISNAEQAAQLSPHADGIVVGSALVDIVERHGARIDAAADELERFARSITAGLGR